MGFYVHLLVLSLAVLGVRGQIKFPTDTRSACETGFEWIPIQKRCMDIDECATMNGGCAHSCQNTKGSYMCGCRTESNVGIKGVKPTVYMRDIENTIAYALRNQAPYTINGAPYANGSQYQILNISQQETLSDFTKALVHHLPLSNSLAGFLNCLSGRLPTSENLTGEGLENLYKNCTAPGKELPLLREWKGCQNYGNASWHQFRSYPCGVWTTFHAMTVNLEQSTQKEASSLLPTLYWLVYNFPWCDTCQGNFINMYNAGKGSNMNEKGADMKTAEDVTMWLWKGHNIVTKRAAGFGLKPGRSHLQFPSIEQCQSCCRGCSILNKKECSAFNLPEVYSYLKWIYTPPFH